MQTVTTQQQEITAAPPVVALPLTISPAQTEATLTDADYNRLAETQWKILTTVNEWLRFQDGKAGAVLAADAALVGTLLSLFKNYQDYFPTHPLVLYPLCLAFLFVVTSAYFGMRCISPTVTTDKYPWLHFLMRPLPTQTTPASLIFFSHIATHETAEEYLGRAEREMCTPEGTVRQIASQVWANSVVAQRKANLVSWAIRWLLGAIALALLTGPLILFGK